jgi:hypothetical protein
MLRCINDVVTPIKPGHQTTGNVHNMVRWVILHAAPYIRKRSHLRYENTQGSLQSRMPGSNSETWEGSIMVWAAISWYSILLVPLLPFMAELLQGSMWTGWVIWCIPWSRCYSWTTYTSIHKPTYLFSPSPFHFHNMFWPYMAIIRCSFAKNCFIEWYIPSLLSHMNAICPNLK